MSTYLRAIGTLLLLALLAGGLLQCTEESTRPGTSGLALALAFEATGGSDTLRVDSVEIQVFAGGALIASETVVVDSLTGSFSSSALALPAGEDYGIRAYAWGSGPDLLPGTARRGILAYGNLRGVRLTRGQVTTETVAMTLAQARPQLANPVYGALTLELHWPPVPGASRYALAWHTEEGTGTVLEELADTSYSLAWPHVEQLLMGSAPEDSFYFRVAPHFGARQGVYGERLLLEPSLWMDVPTLTAIAPAAGDTAVVPESLQVALTFDRALPLAAFHPDSGHVVWSTATGAVSYTAVRDGEDPRIVYLDPPPQTIGHDLTYAVRIDTTLVDSLARPFDGDPAVAHLQPYLVEWRTRPYDPLQVLAMDPPSGSTGLDANNTVLKIALNRPVDPDSLTKYACYVSGPTGMVVTGMRAAIGEGDTILWWPETHLELNTAYTLHVTPRLHDLNGDRLDQVSATEWEWEEFAADFSTGEHLGGPRVVLVDPPNGTTGVEIESSVVVTFSEPVDSSSVVLNETFFVRRGGAGGEHGSLHASADQRTYTFMPRTSFFRSTRYVVEVRGEVRNLSGELFDQDPETAGRDPFTAEFWTETPPQVEFSYPAIGDSGVAIDTLVTIDFTRMLDPASIDGESVRFLALPDSAPVEAARELIIEGYRLTLAPAAPLMRLSEYLVQVTTEVRSLNGSRFDQNLEVEGRQSYDLFFTTEPESLNPAVTAIAPEDEAVDVAIDDSIKIDVSLALAGATVTPASVVITRTSGDGAPVEVSGSRVLSGDLLQITFVPASPWLHFTTYSVRLTPAVTSVWGFPLDQEPDSAGLQDFTSGFRTVQESDPPHLIYTSPADGDTAVAVETNLTLQFSEMMDSASVASAFQLRAGGEMLAGVGTLSPQGKHWVFDPNDPLPYSTVCSVRVATTATDLAGNPLECTSADPCAIAFTTERDRAGPRVLATDPPSGGVDFGVRDTLRILFSEPIAAASLDSSRIRVAPEGGAPVAGVLMAEGDGATLAWLPVDSLSFLTTYTVAVDTLLQDFEGNLLDQDPNAAHRQPYTGSFTTQLETIGPWVQSSDPAHGETSVALDATLALLFSEPVDEATVPSAISLSVNGVAAAGNVTGSAADWSFTPTWPLVGNAVCTLRVATAVVDTLGNPLDQNRATPQLDPFAAVFWTAPDQISPYVTQMIPSSGSDEVSLLPSIRVLFSEPMLASSINALTFHVDAPGSGPVAGTATLEESGTAINWAPSDSLAVGTTYTLVAETTLLDIARNGLDQFAGIPGHQPYEGTFTTVTEKVPPRVILAVPDSGAVEVDPGASIVLFFSEPMDSTSVASAFHLMLADTEIAGAGGWDSADSIWTFAPTDSLARGADFVAILDTTATDANGNLLDQIPATSGREGFARPFTTAAAVLAPRVSGMDPDSGSVGIALTDTLRVYLTKALDPASLTSAAFYVAPHPPGGSAGAPLDGSALLEAAGTIVRWVGDDPFEFGQRYAVVADTFLTDLAGVGLDQDPATTGRQLYRGFVTAMNETIPPSVLLSNPPDGATGVASTAVCGIRFSEAMDSLALKVAGVVTLAQEGGAVVPCALWIGAAADTICLTPEVPLEFSSSYRARVDTLATDSVGNRLDQEPGLAGRQAFESSFETGPAP